MVNHVAIPNKKSSVSIPLLIIYLSTSHFLGKAFPNDDGVAQTNDSSLVVCFGEMLIDFVPTISGLSLADAPAFKKAPGGAPANVAVGIARLGGSSAFIGKVSLDIISFCLSFFMVCKI